MFLLILKTVGWILAFLPEGFVRIMCAFLGNFFFFTASGKRKIILSNLHHAYPHKPSSWHRNIALESCRRMIEMGAFALASPWFDEKRVARILTVPEASLTILNQAKGSMPRGVGYIPHFTLTESLIMISVVVPGLPSRGAIFRPLGNKTLDDWIKRTRERFGFNLYSRKKGFHQALRLIREGGWVNVLFDQNAGLSGAVITSFQRVASATILPGLMAKKLQVPMAVFYAKRTAFWRAQFHAQLLTCDKEPINATLEANAWLEKYLSSSDDACADWLWVHDRWKNQDMPARRFGLTQKKNWLQNSLNYYGWSSLPRKTRFWVRMPNWLGDVIMALPLIRALRRGRPDAEITLVVKADFIPLLKKFKVGDKFIALPLRKDLYFSYFKSLRNFYADTYILFTNSLRGDLEAYLTGCPQRFGMIRRGKWRPFLTHAWNIPQDIDETQHHQTRVWEKFLHNFGLNEQLDYTPFDAKLTNSGDDFNVGLICGTENEPQKRWPLKYWRELAEKLLGDYPKAKIYLFGTDRDRQLTQPLADGLSTDRITGLAGKTNLIELTDKMRECSLIVCNDTGGMHLANALGVSLIALFGPTNPLRTGPIYDTPFHIQQPPNCLPTGGSPLEKIDPARVISLVHSTLD